MRDYLTWRHALALLVTITAAIVIWNGTHLILTEPPRLAHTPVMHVSLASPPAPPVIPKVVPRPPKPVVQKQRAERAPIETSPHAIGPPVSTNAPVTSQNAAPPQPETPPAPAAPPENLSLENSYLGSARLAIEEQKRYPMSKDARLEHPSGTVTVWFVLNRDGQLEDTGIQESAGSILDRAALETLRRATFPRFPDELYPGQSQHRFSAYLRFAPQ